MSRPVWSTAIIAAALLADGCSKPGSSSEATPSSSSSEPPPSAPQPSPVTDLPAGPAGSFASKLVEAGKAPLQPLRFALAPGTKRTAVLTMLVEQEGLPPLAPLKHTIDTTVLEVQPDGRALCSFEIIRSEVVPRPGVHPEVIAGMQEEAATFAGVAGRARRTARGHVEIEAPGNLSAEQRKQLAALQGNIAMVLGLALPAEAVGVGARWEVLTVAGGGMITRGRTTYELLRVDGRKLTLRLSISQRADPGAAAVPLPSGGTLEPLTFELDGGGEVSLDLGQLVPDSFAVEIKTQSTSRVTKDGVSRDEPQRVKVTLTVHGQS